MSRPLEHRGHVLEFIACFGHIHFRKCAAAVRAWVVAVARLVLGDSPRADTAACLADRRVLLHAGTRGLRALELLKLDDLGEHLLMRRAMQALAALTVSSHSRQRREAAKVQLNAIRQQMNLAPLEM